jgi:hypothetical protein
MRCRRIVGRSLQRAERSLTSYTSLELPLHFPRAALFKWVGAAARSQPDDQEQDREGFHLLIL